MGLFIFNIIIIINFNKIIRTWSFWCQLFVVRTNDVGRSVLSTIHNSVNEYKKKLVSNCTSVYMPYIYIHKARHTINNNNDDNNNDHNNNNNNMLFLLCI